MKLKHHNRYPYSSIISRKKFSWPQKKKLAIYIAMIIERFSFGEGIIHTQSYTTPQPDVRNYGWTVFGSRVVICRFFDLVDKLKLPVCHLVNSSVYDHGLEIIKKIRKRKDEIIGHGRTNAESQGELSLEKEKKLIKEATEIIKKMKENNLKDGWVLG